MRVHGVVNLLLLALIIAAVIVSALWKPGITFTVYGTTLELQNLVRDAVLALAALASLWLTRDEHRAANGFTFEPILEVALLFAGIFVCAVPVLAMLDAGHDGAFAWLINVVASHDGSPHRQPISGSPDCSRQSSTTRQPISSSSSSPAAMRPN